MHSKRIISALVFIPLFILLVLKGGFWPFWGLVTTAVLIGLHEFYGLWQNRLAAPYRLLGEALGLFICLAFALTKREALFLALTICIFLVLLRALGEVQFASRELNADLMISVGGTLCGLVYVAWLLGHFIWLRRLPQGREAIFLVCLINAASDTFAYYTGSALGKHRLAPAVSPKKSVEGAIGGLAGSICAAWLAGRWFYPLPLSHLMGLGLVLGVGAQGGDLCESLLKRGAGLKDSGRIIPGHGGLLDRTDSLLFSAPLLYYYLVWIS